MNVSFPNLIRKHDRIKGPSGSCSQKKFDFQPIHSFMILAINHAAPTLVQSL